MNVELSDKEVNEIISLIDQAWCDGFESEELNSIFEKLNSPKEITSDQNLHDEIRADQGAICCRGRTS